MELFKLLQSIVGCDEREEVLERIADLLMPIRHQLPAPINIQYLCSYYKVPVKIERDLQFRYRGKLAWTKSGRAEIYLQHDSDHRRMRFTLAHEIGHWLMQTLVPDLAQESFRKLADRSSSSEEERLADELAAELLMPRRTLRNIGPSSSSLKKLFDIHTTSLVTLPVALSRLSQLRKCDYLHAVFVPTISTDKGSFAVVDVAWVATPDASPALYRDEVETVQRVPFSTLGNADKKTLSISVNQMTCEYEGECQYKHGLMPTVHFLGQRMQMANDDVDQGQQSGKHAMNLFCQ